MRVISFNINGLRARLHQLAAVIERHRPDIIALQETKVSDAEFPQAAIDALQRRVPGLDAQLAHALEEAAVPALLLPQEGPELRAVPGRVEADIDHAASRRAVFGASPRSARIAGTTESSSSIVRTSTAIRGVVSASITR